MPQPDSEQEVAAVRAFNRFYTRKLGVLDQQLLKSPYSLSEARVLYELAHRQDLSAKEIGAELGLDAGYLSRIVQNFDEAGLITREPLPSDRRQYRLALTAKGRQAFAKLERSSKDDVAAMLGSLPNGGRRAPDRGNGRHRATARRWQCRTTTGDVARAAPRRHGMGGAEPRRALRPRIRLRFLVRGTRRRDRGEIPRLVRRVARALLDRRYRRRAGRFDIPGAAHRRCRQAAPAAGRSSRRADRDWVNGWSANALRSRRPAAIAGSRCGPRASCVAARKIYQEAGFKLVATEPHRSFGQDLVGETWELEL